MAFSSFGTGKGKLGGSLRVQKSDSKGRWRGALQEQLLPAPHLICACCVAPAGEDHPWEDTLAAPMGTAPGVIPANKSTT